MILGGPKYSTELFTYSKENRTFIIERSLVDNEFGEMMGPLFDDACDEGFTLVSHLTDKEILYFYADKVYDEEGDVERWNFKECELPGKPYFGTSVVVFND